MTNLHGSEVRDGATYCTDCGVRLEVGSLESMKHTDPITHGRGTCPNAMTIEQRGAHSWFVIAGEMGPNAGQPIFGPVFRAQAEAFIAGVLYGRTH